MRAGDEGGAMRHTRLGIKHTGFRMRDGRWGMREEGCEIRYRGVRGGPYEVGNERRGRKDEG